MSCSACGVVPLVLWRCIPVALYTHGVGLHGVDPHGIVPQQGVYKIRRDILELFVVQWLF
jgi:hypothetical protein